MVPLRAAVYRRVSTDKQSNANQQPEIEQVIKTRGYTVVATYEEQVSAAKVRPEHQRMMKAAKHGKFDVLVIWALDRFGRSMVGNLGDVLELDRVGVKVVSVRETWLDTSGPVRTLLIAIFGWVAEQETARLALRTKAGLEAARRRGIRLGRPPARLDVDELQRLRGQGKSIRQIAELLDVGPSTIQRHLSAVGGSS